MKTNNFFSKTALGVLLVIYLAMMASQAYAELYTFEFTSDSYVVGTTHIKGGFDIKERISSVFGGQAYAIDNAQLTFYFTDDNTDDITTQTVQTTDWTGSNGAGFDRDKTTFKIDEGETAGVLIEGVNFSKSSSGYTVVNSTGTEITDRPYEVQTGTKQVQTGSYCCNRNIFTGSCNGYCPTYSTVPVYTTYYAQERTHLYENISGANGDLSFRTNATAEMLNCLKTVGYVAFDIFSLQGDFRFLNATLSVNVNGINQTVIFVAGTGGTITGNTPQTVKNSGNSTEVTAVPDAGYKFVNWTGTGGFAASTTNPLIVSSVTTDMTITANFRIVLPGDVNGDEKVDLADAILALQIVAGITPDQIINLDADVNSDGKIGMEEIAYILQKVAGLRE